MPKEPFDKVTMNLREGDFHYLQTAFPKLGAGPFIRRLVSNYVDQLRKKHAEEEKDL